MLSTSVIAKDKWYISDPNGFGYYLTTEVKSDSIKGYTRKNALKNIVGWAKFTLVKFTTSIKHPEIINIKGKIDGNKISGKIQNLFSERSFTGEINQDSLTLKVKEKNDTFLHLTGHKVTDTLPKRDYVNIYKHIFELTEKNLYKQNFIKTKEWVKFKQQLLKLASKIKDDLEMQIAFYALVREFPFSHYQLNPNLTKPSKKTKSNNFAKLTEINTNTVVLDIDSFTGTKQQMVDLLEQVKRKKYKNLIIDLRDNYGGNFLSAYPLGQFLIEEPFIAGVFPNQKWYRQHNRIPTLEEYSQFSEFSDGTMEQWLSKTTKNFGVYYKVYPSQNHFNGQVYVLTNRSTASTCEPLVYALKKEKIATIIGENTSGAMLSMKSFKIGNDISLGIPISDYITSSGERIDKVGVKPHIKVDSNDALDKALEVIAAGT